MKHEILVLPGCGQKGDSVGTQVFIFDPLGSKVELSFFGEFLSGQ
jgi:hypothetical protein